MVSLEMKAVVSPFSSTGAFIVRSDSIVSTPGCGTFSVRQPPVWTSFDAMLPLLWLFEYARILPLKIPKDERSTSLRPFAAC